MHFIFGGRGMGMLEYAKGQMDYPVVCDLEHDGVEAIGAADIVTNIHGFIKQMVLSGENALGYFTHHVEDLQNKIVIGDEVGSGIVPVEPFERAWRDETGRVYQLLAANASDVTRLWAGLPQALKRGGRADA